MACILGGSAGFSIGFDKELLSRYIQETSESSDAPMMGGRCNYEEAVQRAFLHDRVHDIGPVVMEKFRTTLVDFKANRLPKILEGFQRNSHSVPVDKLISNAKEQITSEYLDIMQREANDFSASMIHCIAQLILPPTFMKRPAFKQEREWRIIKLLNGTPKEVRFRPGKSSLIPYIAIPLPIFFDDHTSLIRRIVVGPSPEIKDAAAAVRMLVKSKGCMVRGPGETRGIEVVPSKIPYRDW